MGIKKIPFASDLLDANAVDALTKCGHTIDPTKSSRSSWAPWPLHSKLVRLPPEPEIEETEDEKVVRILKGDFEKIFGMPYERFVEVYNNMLKNNPEKLI